MDNSSENEGTSRETPNYEGKLVVLITGCSSGIGKSLAAEFHKHNDQFAVFASSRRLDSMLELEKKGIQTIEIDVTKEETIEKGVSKIISETGRIDILINNAGINTFGPLLESPLKDFQQIMDVNVTGVVRMIQTVAPFMIKRKSGVIMNVTSLASYMPAPFSGCYNASKFAVLALNETFRVELSNFGIAVVNIRPGLVKSELAPKAWNQVKERVYEYYQPCNDGIELRANQSVKKNPTPSKDAAESLIMTVRKRINERNELKCMSFPRIVPLGKSSVSMPFLARILPSCVLDCIFKRKFKLNKLNKWEEKKNN